MRISFSVTQSSDKTKKALEKLTNASIYRCLEKYGLQGKQALADATPREDGSTAEAWDYHVYHKNGNWGILWTNTYRDRGFPVAIMLQYGHGTGTGGWVQGRDYINPAIRPVMDRIAEEVWKEVTRA